MKSSMVAALALGLLGAMMATGAVRAAPTDTGQSARLVAGKDKQALQRPKRALKAPLKAAGTVAPGSDRMFNPQPELPDKNAKAAGVVAPGSDRMFNPQPELPDKSGKTTGSAVKVANPGTAKTFNPQPELPDQPAPAGSN